MVALFAMAIYVVGPTASFAADVDSPKRMSLLVRDVELSVVAELDDIKRDSGNLHLVEASTPRLLATPEGRAAARARVAALRAIGTRLAAWQERTVTALARAIAALPESADNRILSAAFDQVLPELRAVTVELRQEYGNLADATAAEIDWCEAQGGALKVQLRTKRFADDRDSEFLLTTAQSAQLAAIQERISVASSSAELAFGRAVSFRSWLVRSAREEEGKRRSSTSPAAVREQSGMGRKRLA